MGVKSLLAVMKHSATEKKYGSRKYLLIGGAVFVLGAGFLFFSGGKETPLTSRLPGVPNIRDNVQGGAPVSPAYEQELTASDKQRIDQAKKSGESALKTIRGERSEIEIPELPDPAQKKPEVVRPVEPIQTPVPVVARPIIASPASKPTVTRQVDKDRVGGMLKQMQEIMKGQQDLKAADVKYYYKEPTNGGSQAGSKQPRQQIAATSPSSSKAPDAKSSLKLPMAGDVLYGKLTGRVISDVKGPVIATLLEGPYAGATLIGSFQTAEDAVLISFDQMTIKKDRDGNEINKTLQIKAVAVDTQYIGTALATDVDSHMWEKISIGFAKSFISGLGKAIANQGQVAINRTDGSSITATPSLNTKEQLMVASGDAADTVGDVLMREYANKSKTITVDQNTPIGVLFLSTPESNR